jgi:titin
VYGGATNTRIGTNGDGIGDTLERNVISANNFGIDISGAGTTGTIVAGNYIGTNATGNSALGNGFAGVVVNVGASSNRVGVNGGDTDAAGESNLISGNGWVGLAIVDSGTQNNVVAGNLIGTDATGKNPLGNSSDGIWVAGGAVNTLIGTNGDGNGDAAERNVISGNHGYGVEISDSGTSGTVVAGNYIGTDISGLVPFANASDGIVVHNGASNILIGTDGKSVDDSGERNILGASPADDILISNCHDVVIAGNYVGTDVTGTHAFSVGGQAIDVHDSTAIRIGTDGISADNASEANVISGNTPYGNWLIQGAEIFIQNVTNSVIAGNYVGVDPRGEQVVANAYIGIQIYLSSGIRVGDPGHFPLRPPP